jgi:NADPH-dependent 2,4-dienoyl-CoA reductase/sulfur reductase-like enzyme
MCSHESSDKRTFVIIGAGAAGAAAAEALRQAKFTGRIILLSREKHLPYDRLQCTKDIKSTMESIVLRSKDFYRRIGVEVRLGVSGSEIDIQRKELKLSDGSILSFDKALIATGSDARQVVEPSVIDNAFVLRTFDDLDRLRAKMRGARNFVIVGSSFIGLEACAMIKKHFDDAKDEDQAAQKIQITVIGMEKFPLERVLGAEIGQALQALHQENGVRFVMETVLQPSDYVTQSGSITAIKTKNERLPADIVIVGAGAIPSLQKEEGAAGFWTTTVPPVAPSGTLRVIGRPLLGNNSISVDQHMHVANDVYAAGDIAEMPFKGERIRVEHWGMAEQQGRVAAFHMAGSSDHRATLDAVPFFWTKQYGVSVRYVGYCSKPDKILVGPPLRLWLLCSYSTPVLFEQPQVISSIFSQVDGDVKSRNKCSVFYTQGNSVRAVATIGCGASKAFNFGTHAKFLYTVPQILPLLLLQSFYA